MKNPYPEPLPPVLYVVSTERVRAGKPPIVLRNPQYSGDGDNARYYVHAGNPKFEYRIERCWATPEEAAAEVKRIGLALVAGMQTQMTKLQQRVRQARELTAELVDQTPSP